MLDPHAANPDMSGEQYSVADNLLGWVAKGEIDKYQAKAHDPPATVPAVRRLRRGVLPAHPGRPVTG